MDNALLQQDDKLAILATRFADAIARNTDISRAAAFRTTLQDDGSWPDIDYSDKTRSSWPVGAHLRTRLGTLAADWHRTGNRNSLAAAHSALDFWLQHRFDNPNWWWNVIGVPVSIGDAALLMGEELTDNERKGVIEVMTVKEPDFAKTGQNFAWLAGNRLRRGLLARDVQTVHEALNDILKVVRLGDAEGIQPDWCFHQHGAQPQFGNYGLSFLRSQSRLAVILAGSDFPYPSEKFAILGQLASEGYSWICWKGMMDVSALGRQLYRDAQRQKGAAVEAAFGDLAKAGWRPPSPRLGFRYFDRSAYAVYRAPGFMASVRASTPKIIGVETWINEDNAKGMCMADGALMTYVSGREYENVFPLWDDWRMIPGVTGYLGKPTRREDSRNERDDIRAAAEGDGGHFAFTFSREGLTARKKWTFSPGGILCEGEGIAADDGEYEVATCVEHALAADNAGIVSRGRDVSRFRNGALLYTVHAPAEAICFEVAEREGDFSTFMLGVPPSPEKGRVFSLRILHGKAPRNASYRYEIARVAPA
jgi:chondroitin AC lyase